MEASICQVSLVRSLLNGIWFDERMLDKHRVFNSQMLEKDYGQLPELHNLGWLIMSSGRRMDLIERYNGSRPRITCCIQKEDERRQSK